MRRIVSVAGAVGATLLLAAPSPNAAAPKPQIEDPYGDANFVNDQGDGNVGDVSTPVDAGDASDLGAVTFTSDARFLYINVRTEAPPPATEGIGLSVQVNGDPGSQCLVFNLLYPGATNNRSTPEAHFYDECRERGPVDAPELIPIRVRGTRFIVPRGIHEAFGKGKVLTNPQAQSFLFSTVSPVVAVWGPRVDTTKVGADFEFRN